MRHRPTSRALARIVAGVSLVLLLPAGAEAAGVRHHYYSATSVCEAPLPVYDATLRKRPLGISNEGTTPIFISCSLPTDFVGDRDTNTVQIHFASMGAAGFVTCTLVAGTRNYGAIVGVAASTSVGANGTSFVSWNQVDKRDTYGTLNFSCNLPRDIEMNLLIAGEQDTGGGL